MDIIHQSAEWFHSQSATEQFATLTKKEEQTLFLFSYLRQIANKSFPTNQLVFQTAFLLADEVLGSDLPYAAYPDIISPQSNPFVAYLVNGNYINNRITLANYLAILHNKVDAFDKGAWIYDKTCSSDIPYGQRGAKEDCDFFSYDVFMPSRERYAIDESLQKLQLKIIWMLSDK